jgi:AraC-like DNA-binding protein
MRHALKTRYALPEGWAEGLSAAGYSVSKLLREAQLSAERLLDPSPRLPTEDYFRLWRAVERQSVTEAPALALLAQVTHETFAPAVIATLCSPTLAGGFTRLSRFKGLMGPLQLRVMRPTHGLELDLFFLEQGDRVPDSLVLLELLTLVRLSRLGTDEALVPTRVQAPLQRPAAAAYSRFFGTPIQPGKVISLQFSALDAERRFVTANRILARHYPESMAEGATPLQSRVKRTLMITLPSGHASVEVVAERLGTSPRTLQRQLQHEGMSFQLMLHETRLGLANHYLKGTDFSHTEIAYLLGFTDPNSFFRAYQSWTRTTPEQARQDALA